MVPLKSFRSIIFNVVDTLTGGHNQRHYNDVKNHIEQGLNNCSQLKGLLDHARQSTPYYQNLNLSAHASLDAFPVVNKNTIRTHYNQFKSQEFKQKTLHVATTSANNGVVLNKYVRAIAYRHIVPAAIIYKAVFYSNIERLPFSRL